MIIKASHHLAKNVRIRDRGGKLLQSFAWFDTRTLEYGLAGRQQNETGPSGVASTYGLSCSGRFAAA